MNSYPALIMLVIGFIAGLITAHLEAKGRK